MTDLVEMVNQKLCGDTLFIAVRNSDVRIIFDKINEGDKLNIFVRE